MDQMQYEKSNDSRAGMFDDYEREKQIERKNIERNNFRCEQKKMRSKVDLLFMYLSIRFITTIEFDRFCHG